MLNNTEPPLAPIKLHVWSHTICILSHSCSKVPNRREEGMEICTWSAHWPQRENSIRNVTSGKNRREITVLSHRGKETIAMSKKVHYKVILAELSVQHHNTRQKSMSNSLLIFMQMIMSPSDDDNINLLVWDFSILFIWPLSIYISQIVILKSVLQLNQQNWVVTIWGFYVINGITSRDLSGI